MNNMDRNKGIEEALKHALRREEAPEGFAERVLARVSERHANFFVNAGQASAADMLALIADVRERVQQAYGITLENEVVVWNA